MSSRLDAETGSPEPEPEPAALLDAARARAGQMREFLERLVAMETPSLDPATQEPAFALLREGLESAGLQCRHRRGRESGGYLVARDRARRGGPWQLIVGHCDTVWPVGTLAGMPLREEEGRLHGPGIFDMKAGLTQAIFALRMLRELGLEPAVRPVVLVNSDEEVGSTDSYAAIVRLAKRVDRTFVVEPALGPEGKLKTARKGVAQYRIRVRGRAAHAGLNPEQGVSAILELSLLVQRLFALNDLERGVSVNVGTIDGGLRPNVIAPESSAVVDVRVPTIADAEHIDAAIRGLQPSHPDVRIEVEPTEGRMPLEPSPGGRRLWAAASRLAGAMGLPLSEGRAGGGSDGNITNLYTPTLDGLGAVGDGAHATHEHVELERMPERMALLAGLLLQPAVSRLPEPAT